MMFFYNIAVYLTGFALKIVALFNKKIRLFVVGRANTFGELSGHFSKEEDVLWFHCASLGEFEQGRPIMENYKSKWSQCKILVTFFSPSGYEIRKNYKGADRIVYLPLDTKSNAKKFLDVVNPSMAIFIKYEFWPNILQELKRRNIHTLLVSGIFRKEQPFFKWYGKWMRNSLITFDHFFVQNQHSKYLLGELNFTNVTVSGDTRFDRVYQERHQEINLALIDQFKGDATILIAGSTWPKDEEMLIRFINTSSFWNQKYIIAPHTINDHAISKLMASIQKKSALYSELGSDSSFDYDVLIINSIGLLSKIYHYGNIAYVGGGFGVGIHNILEPATFSLPIIIGPNYEKFQEAKDLVSLGACVVVNNYESLEKQLTQWITNHNEAVENGRIASNYILENRGATQIISNHIDQILQK